LAAPASLYPLTVLSDNPMAYWRLGEAEGNLVHDRVAGHDCICANVQLGSPGYSAFDPDTAAGFGLLAASNSYAGERDGSGGGVANVDFAQPSGGSAGFSVEVWVNGKAQTQDAGIVTKGYGKGGEQFNLDTGSDTVATHGFRFFVRDAGGAVHSAASTVVPNGQWRHVVGLCDETNGWVHLYIDGVDCADGEIPAGAGLLAAAGGAAPGASLVSLGARTSSKTATSFDCQFVGTVDEVAIYAYALSASQVTAHYQAGSAALQCTNFALRGTKLILNGLGGISNGAVTLLASTNLLLPLTNWTASATNAFDGSGRFNLTNTVDASVRRQFYALQVAPAPSALWLPACGAWLGAACTNGSTQAFTDHESRIGRPLDVLRIYHTPGSWTSLTSSERTYINAGQKLLLSVKPASLWSNAVGALDGGSATVDGQMTTLAQSIAGVRPAKVMLIVWHEPENDVIGGGGPGNAGTTAQYVAMWHNVRGIFDANSATNVIWCWCIQNLSQYRSLLASLWPGNDYVDWVMWDAYQDSASQSLTNVIQAGYNWLMTNSTPANNYGSKPFGLGELGVGINSYYPTVADQTNGINQLNAALNRNDQFPKLKLISYFDLNPSALLPGTIPAYTNFAHSLYLTQQCP